MNKRFYSIELLRFLASLAVILYHYKIGFAWDKGYVDTVNLSLSLPFYKFINLFYNYGFYGVQLFFLISGFVFAHIYINKKNLVSLKEFFINRFARLYPLHFITLALIILFFLIDQNFIKGQFNLERGRFFDLYHFFLNIFFVHSWGLEKGLSFNSPTWTVSIEIGAYVTFFILLKFLRKNKILFPLILIILLFCIYKTQLLNFKYSEYLLLFYIGIIVYQFPIKTYLKTFLFISIFLILSSFFGRNFKILLFCPGVLILAIYFDNYINNLNIKTCFSFLGSLTYSLYLLHYPLMLIFLWMEEKNNYFNSFYENNIFLLVYISLLIFFSFISFKLVENPLNIKIRKRFLQKNKRF